MINKSIYFSYICYSFLKFNLNQARNKYCYRKYKILICDPADSKKISLYELTDRKQNNVQTFTFPLLFNVEFESFLGDPSACKFGIHGDDHQCGRIDRAQESLPNNITTAPVGKYQNIHKPLISTKFQSHVLILNYTFIFEHHLIVVCIL